MGLDFRVIRHRPAREDNLDERNAPPPCFFFAGAKIDSARESGRSMKGGTPMHDHGEPARSLASALWDRAQFDRRAMQGPGHPATHFLFGAGEDKKGCSTLPAHCVLDRNLRKSDIRGWS